MDISQIGSAQWQSLLDTLDPAAALSGTTGTSDPFANLLQSTQSAAAANSSAANDSTGSLAMLQALQNMNGLSASDPFLQLMNSANGTASNDPLLQALQGINGTSTNDPLIQMMDSANATTGTDDTESMFNGNFAVLDALQSANAFAGGNSSNALAMLQALNSSNSAALQAGL